MVAGTITLHSPRQPRATILKYHSCVWPASSWSAPTRPVAIARARLRRRMASSKATSSNGSQTDTFSWLMWPTWFSRKPLKVKEVAASSAGRNETPRVRRENMYMARPANSRCPSREAV